MTIRTYHAAELPTGTLITSPGYPGSVRRRPDATIGLPWKRDPGGARYTHAEVDRWIAAGNVVTVPGRDAAAPLHDVLRVGLDWLYRVEQPGTAVVTHHGYRCRVGDRTIAFLPYMQPIVVAKCVDPDHTYGGQAELDLMTSTLAQTFGRPVAESWNGLGSVDMASYRLADMIEGTSLWAAHRRYMAKCPRHGNVFCGQSLGCPWLAVGYAAAVEPAWPAVPGPAAPGSPERVTAGA